MSPKLALLCARLNSRCGTAHGDVPPALSLDDEPAVAVLDVGKTNVKLALFNKGRLLWEKSASNAILPGPPYPHEDVDSVWAFFFAALSEAARGHKIGALVPTAHGAAGALIGASDLVLPVMD